VEKNEVDNRETIQKSMKQKLTLKKKLDEPMNNVMKKKDDQKWQ
jgi:hypothetical protein